jgi:hypothetical protein
VSKNEISAQELERELAEAKFNSRTKLSRVVGYIEAGSKLQSI